MTAGAVAAMNSEPEAKRARIEPENQEKETVLQKKNLIEIDGKSCTHEVAWPPGKGLSPSFYLFFRLFNFAIYFYAQGRMAKNRKKKIDRN